MNSPGNEVKHGGCYECKTKLVQVLISIVIPTEKIGFAVCSNCAATPKYKPYAR